MSVPGRVDAAMQFLRYAQDREFPHPAFEGMKGEPRDLTPKEQAAADAALEVLRKYFACEADFGDTAPTATATPEGSPVAVPAEPTADPTSDPT